MNWIIGLSLVLAAQPLAAGDPTPPASSTIEADLDRLAQAGALLVVNRQEDGTRTEKRVQKVMLMDCDLWLQIGTLPNGGLVISGARLGEGSTIGPAGPGGEIAIQGASASDRATIRVTRSADAVVASLQAAQRKCAEPAILFPAPGGGRGRRPG
ncbi:hypothetical protein [Sphingomonas sanxanigenens]|uniref:Uncharacterized protein n=1 Tax=Sphingomonas sanxanigenens DSM 19645 = NX02 TaxID=1123269 RepID=W0A620_9SPHN|nr:hypothetical protein [Sphingomonas sanxanigenens]AHE52476.1 hypothetical protein NX02_03610 [Sphingomonas sanxanigenens DSM 19645 = NX02]